MAVLLAKFVRATQDTTEKPEFDDALALELVDNKLDQHSFFISNPRQDPTVMGCLIYPLIRMYDEIYGPNLSNDANEAIFLLQIGVLFKVNL